MYMIKDDYINKLNDLLSAIEKVNRYCINEMIASTKRTIENFNFDSIFEEILIFLDEKSEDIEALMGTLSCIEGENVNISSRIKSEQSLYYKWNKNLGKCKQLREVINDIIGIRMIIDEPYDEIIKKFKQLQENYAYNINIVDFHDKPKTKDDGYRGIHIYFKENPRGFPIELQIWNQEDALLNFYTHDIIYKTLSDESAREYSLNLRKWLDDIPQEPKNVQLGLIRYLYEIVYASQGGE